MSNDAGIEPLVLAARRELDRRGWTQRRLADETCLAEATIFRFFKGQFGRRTALRIGTVLGLEADGPGAHAGPSPIASPDCGSYSREAFAAYVGDFLICRRGFSNPETVVRGLIRFDWPDMSPGLRFREYNIARPSPASADDWALEGLVHSSDFINLLHLLTVVRGAVRLTTLSKMRPGADDRMYGLVLTQCDPDDLHYRPAVSPVVLERHPAGDLGEDASAIARAIGVLRPGDADYAQAMERLGRAERAVSVFQAGLAGV